MNAFKTRHIEKITLCFGTQLGKSEAILNMIGYAIDQDPGAMLFVYPTDELGKSISKNRLISMITASDALRAKYLDRESEQMELQFMGMYIAIVGANSPSKLASRPVRYVFYDETDKFPAFSGKEGSPTELASERTKNYHNRKEVEASSPTYADGHIWRSFISADVSKCFYVPCPTCGEMQVLKNSQIKWPKKYNEDAHKYDRAMRVLTDSWYECEFCKQHIYDMDKQKMLLAGEWRAVEYCSELKRFEPAKEVPSRPRHVGYTLSSLYSPWVTFGQVANKFLKTKDETSKFMNFVNGWLAEPWEPQATKLRRDIVFKRQAAHQRGELPEKTQLLTCGIDVQQNSFWWVVRAWGPKLTSWLVDFGQAETWGEIDRLLDREFGLPDGNKMLINLGFMDSGDQTDEVYEYCATQTGLLFPSKGSSLTGNARPRLPLTESQVDRDGYGAMKLFILDTHYYKSFIAGRLNRNNDDPGAFLVYKGEGEQDPYLTVYAEQLCSEHLIREEDKKGNKRDIWKPVIAHADNHLLDCEVLAVAAAERLGVRYLKEEDES